MVLCEWKIATKDSDTVRDEERPKRLSLLARALSEGLQLSG
jgi:hypothetical protein